MCEKAICLAVVAALVVGALPVATHAQVANLLKNGSFEEDEVILNDPLWDKWSTWASDTGVNSTVAIDTNEFVDGTRSLRVVPQGGTALYFIVQNGPLSLKVGTSFTASFWAKAEAPRPLHVNFTAWDGSVDCGNTDFHLTTEWAEYSLTSAANNATGKLVFFCVAGSEVPFWLDFVFVYEGEHVFGIKPSGLSWTKSAVPAPGANALDVPRDTVLGWTPGEFAETHDVYFGTVLDDVNIASRTDPRGVLAGQGQTATTFDPAGLLAFGQTYYWRVDEVNAPPDSTISKGDVWSFTVEPYGYPVKPSKATASSSMTGMMGPDKTIDGSGLDAMDQHSVSASQMWLSKKGQSPVWIQYQFDAVCTLHQMWVWNSNQAAETAVGLGSKAVMIETSLDGTTWTALAGVPEFAQATGEPNYVHNTTVDFGGVQAKYVKLTINSNWAGGTKQAGLSEVRFFYVPVKAFGPTPATGATGVALDAVLNWRPGREAVQHKVYLGTDPSALALVNTVTGHSLGLGSLGLEYDRTYYWKVGEVNDAATPSTWEEGDVWTFSTPAYAVVDDFEGYNDTCRRIFFAWVDGLGHSGSTDCGIAPFWGNGTGSVVGNSTPPFAEQTVVHGSGQAMPLAYDNTTGKASSEAIRSFDVAQDWTLGNAQMLVLFFRGEETNGVGQLYVEVNDSKVLYYGAANAMAKVRWVQWTIDLASVGTNLKAVKNLCIGVSGPVTGRLYVDDIRLYREAPVPVDPGTTGLAAYYAFEGNTKDRSGHGYDGTVMGNETYGDGLAGYGKAIWLDGSDDYVDLPIGTLVSTLTSTSVAAWVDFSNTGRGWERVFDFGAGLNDYMCLTPRQGTTGPMTFEIRTPTVAEKQFAAPATLGTGWRHVAVVIDSATMKVALYLDGAVVWRGSTTVLPKDLGKTTQNWLGRSQWPDDGYFGGLLDEFRIYSRALSEGEVRYLAGDR